MTADQLRKSILQQAIEGKLVPQLPSDEPASALLARIREEKARLVQAKQIKKEKNPSIIFRGDDNSFYEHFTLTGEVKCIDDEIPFEIPESWQWCRLKDVFTMQAGKNIKAEHIHTEKSKEHEYPCYGGNGLRGYVATYNTEGNFPLVGRQGALCGNVNMAYGRFYATEHAVVTDGYGITNVNWAYSFLLALNLNQYATATAQPGLAVSNILEILLPLPSLSEQHRIVEKIEELMPLVEQYGKAQRELDQLNADLREQLKKSILQHAIEGKLVPQRPKDGTAEELLARIREEKARLVQAKQIKKEKNPSTIFRGDDNSFYEHFTLTGEVKCIDEEIPFEIPETWQWCRLGDICEYIQRGKSPKYSLIKKYPVIAQKCNQWSGFSIEKAQFIEPESISSYGEERKLQDLDLLWNSTGLGTLGRMAIYYSRLNPYELAVADSHVTVIRAFKQYVCPKYLYAYFSSNVVQSVIEEKSDGSTKQKELAIRTVKAYLLPLPPLSEQHRIVAKIEELMQLIDKMEMQ